MSILWLNWAFSRPMCDGPAKAVLVALADHANDGGTCWPSITRLSLMTALAERTIQLAIKRLAALGAITTVPRPGRATLTTLNPDWPGQLPAPAAHAPPHALHPAPDAPPPPQEMRPTPAPHAPAPAPRAPEPSLSIIEPSEEPPLAPRRLVRTKEPADDRRAQRLPADWTLRPEERAYAVDRGLDPDATAENFRDYWRAKAGAGGVKRDWSATWRIWCRSPYNRPRPAGHHPGGERTGFARGGDGVVAAAQRVLQRRGLGEP